MTRKHPFRVLIAHDDILRRIQEIGDGIVRDYPGEPPLLVAVIEGARTFARHLQRLLGRGCMVHEIRASSYGDGTTSSGRVAVGPGPEVEVAGRNVLLIEDIVDTGRTVATLRQLFLRRGARDCRVASLLSKPSRRLVDVPIAYLGFEIPDEFVIGFGMDFAGRYRELPDIVVYEEQRAAAAVP